AGYCDIRRLSIVIRWLPGMAGAGYRCGRGQVVLLAEVVEGFLDAPGVGGSDALVDRERLPQLDGALAGGAVPDGAGADAFQGACLFVKVAKIAGDREGLAMVFAGLLSVGGLGQELAEAVQRFGLAEMCAGFAEQVQCLPVAGGGGPVVPGQSLQD